MSCVYILQSERNQRFYVGSTNDFERRLAEHQRGHSVATRGRGPWRLVYQEQFESLDLPLGSSSGEKNGSGGRVVDWANIFDQSPQAAVESGAFKSRCELHGRESPHSARCRQPIVSAG